MNDQSFSLQPSASASPLPHLKVTGNIARRSNTLAISYTLHGHLAAVVIPAPADMAARKNRRSRQLKAAELPPHPA